MILKQKQLTLDLYALYMDKLIFWQWNIQNILQTHSIISKRNNMFNINEMNNYMPTCNKGTKKKVVSFEIACKHLSTDKSWIQIMHNILWSCRSCALVLEASSNETKFNKIPCLITPNNIVWSTQSFLQQNQQTYGLTNCKQNLLRLLQMLEMLPLVLVVFAAVVFITVAAVVKRMLKPTII